MNFTKPALGIIAALLFAISVPAQKKITITLYDLYYKKNIEVEYKGEIVNGMANGKGEAKDGKLLIYTGMWKDNLFEGKGKFTSGYLTYDGDWVAGKREGYGEYSNSNYSGGVTFRTSYAGNWKDDVFSGKGKISLTNTGNSYDLETYEGEWLNGKRNGQGIAKNGGRKWEGQWKDNALHGKGTYFQEYDGQQYVGDWYNGNKQGIGTFKWPNGDVYQGGMYNNQMDGKGVYNWKDGSKYDGEWRNSQKHGNGTLVLANGEKYTGQFVNNLKEGYGSITWVSGAKYTGAWLNNAPGGTGTYFFTDGRQYTGQMEAGWCTGRGKMTYPDGKTEDGIFEKAKFIRSANPIKKINYPDGSFYVGEVVDTIREGNGKMTYKNGNVYDGGWHNNKRSGQGKLQYSTGGSDEGRYEEGDMVYGTAIRANGAEAYTGALKNGKPYGWGKSNVVRKNANGTITTEEYSGQWAEGKKHGMGELTTGCDYVKGEFVNDAMPVNAYHKNVCKGGDDD
jgi:hypothetical protein